MSANVSVLTDQGKTTLEFSSTALQASVLAHIYNDYGVHNSIRVYAVPYTEPSTGHQVSTHTLRIVLTHPTDGVITVALPCFLGVAAGGTAGVAPIILTQPATTIVLDTGATAQITVVIASQTQPAYQWQKAASLSDPWLVLPGQIASTLILTDVTTADNGLYRVIVTNSYGSVTSTACTLTIHP
jgi:hypothetical protein